MQKIEVELGTISERIGSPVPGMMDVEELLGTRLLIQGNSGSGKSHLLRRLLEQSAPHVQQVVVDPEGDFVSFKDKFNHVVIEANRSEADLVAIAVKARQQRVSVVLDLSALEVDMQMRAAAYFLNAMFDAERSYWYPCLVAVDEAQLFAPSASGDVAEDARKLSLGAMTNLMCRGRKRGLAGIIATQRLAKLAKNVAAECSNFLMGRTFLDIDMDRAADLLGIDKKKAEMFRELPRGSFVALGPALYRSPKTIAVGTVETRALGSTPSLTPPPVPTAAEALDIVSSRAPTLNGRAMVPRPQAPVAAPLDDVLAQVEHETPDVHVAETMSDVERADAFRSMLAEVVADPDFDFKPDSEVYQHFLAHCRIKKVKPAGMDEFTGYLAEARSGVDPTKVGDEGWAHAMAVAETLPNDVKAVYLLLAEKAMRGAPCPSDATIAKVCGSFSPSRGRARVGQLEKDAFIVLQKDMRGHRVVVLPDLKWRTAPGDPNAPGILEVA